MKKSFAMWFLVFMLFVGGCENGEVTTNEPDIPKNVPSQSSEPEAASPKSNPVWNVATIMTLFESGKISDQFDFTLGDDVYKVVSKVGRQTSKSDEDEWYVADDALYTKYGDILVFYEIFDDPSKSPIVSSVVFMNEGKYFGLVIGEATVAEVETLFGNPALERYTISEFEPSSLSEPDEGEPLPTPDGRYFCMDYMFGEYPSSNISLQFHFTDDVLKTVCIYH